MTQGIKENIIYGSALFMLIFGVGLTIAGFIIPPAGQVHDSVLWVLGQCLIYAGSGMGISAYTSGKMREMQRGIDRRFDRYERRHRRGDCSISSTYDDDEEEQQNEQDDETEQEL